MSGDQVVLVAKFCPTTLLESSITGILLPGRRSLAVAFGTGPCPPFTVAVRCWQPHSIQHPHPRGRGSVPPSRLSTKRRHRDSPGCPLESSFPPLLTNACSTTLNQKEQHQNKQHARYDADYSYAIHEFSFSPLTEILLHRFLHHDNGRSQHYDEQRWKDEQNQREDQFDGHLRRYLLHTLPPLDT